MPIMVQASFSRCIWLIILVVVPPFDNLCKIQQLEVLVLKISHYRPSLDNLERSVGQWVKFSLISPLRQHLIPTKASMASQISSSIHRAEARPSAALRQLIPTQTGQRLGVRQAIPWKDGAFDHSSSRRDLLHQLRSP